MNACVLSSIYAKRNMFLIYIALAWCWWQKNLSYIVYYFPYFDRASISSAIFILVINFDVLRVSSLDLTFSSCYSFFQAIFSIPLLYGILSPPLSGCPNHSAFSDGDSFVVCAGQNLLILHPIDWSNEYSFYRSFSFFISL